MISGLQVKIVKENGDMKDNTKLALVQINCIRENKQVNLQKHEEITPKAKNKVQTWIIFSDYVNLWNLRRFVIWMETA